MQIASSIFAWLLAAGSAVAGSSGFTVAVDSTWAHDPPGRAGSAHVFRKGTDVAAVTMVFRLVQTDGRSAEEWFDDGVRAATAAGAVPIRPPCTRPLGVREWREARFTTLARDRKTMLATVVSATQLGPDVLEAYLRGPDDQVAAALADFERARSGVTRAQATPPTASAPSGSSLPAGPTSAPRADLPSTAPPPPRAPRPSDPRARAGA